MTTDVALVEEVRELLADVFRVDDVDLPDDVSQETYERWTSLYHMTLLVTLEEHFDTLFSMEEIVSMTSLQEIIAVLSAHTSA